MAPEIIIVVLTTTLGVSWIEVINLAIFGDILKLMAILFVFTVVVGVHLSEKCVGYISVIIVVIFRFNMATVLLFKIVFPLYNIDLVI